MEDWTNPDFARNWDSRALVHNLMRTEQLDILLSIISDVYQEGATILDVGMGSGRVEQLLFERLPSAQVVGTDFSEAMLSLARAHLSPYQGHYEVVMQDLTHPFDAKLPDRDYALAFSVQVIHNVAHPHKRETYSFIEQTLSPGGLFLLLDRIRVSTPTLFPAYLSLWDRLDRERSTDPTANRREGATFEEHEISVSTRGDQPATLEENLQWLRDAGFAEVACLHLHANRALFAARKKLEIRS